MDETGKPKKEPGTGSEGKSSEILDELRELGQNLRSLLQSAWESDERKKMQHEIETGLNDLYTDISQTVKDFSESPTGQDLKSDLEDLGERIRTGEVEAKIRSEVVSALHAANESLKNTGPKEPAPKDGSEK